MLFRSIRAIERPAGLPRQVLARASLNARTLDEAADILTTYPRSGAFHHTLGQAGDRRLWSVEATGTGCNITPVGQGFGHSNHLVSPALSTVAQVVTASSADRQQRVNAWLRTRHDALLATISMTTINRAILMHFLRNMFCQRNCFAAPGEYWASVCPVRFAPDCMR